MIARTIAAMHGRMGAARDLQAAGSRAAFGFVAFAVSFLGASSSGATLRLQKGAVSPFYPDGYSGTQDVYIDSKSPDRNYGLDWEFTIGSMPKGAVRRGLMRWDLRKLKSLFSDQRIAVVSVELKLGLWYNQRIPHQAFDIYRIKAVNAGWREGDRRSGNFNGMVTWNSVSHGTRAWAGAPGCGKPGVDFDPIPVASFTADAVGHMRPRYLPPIELPLALVRSWALEPDKNAGLLIRRHEEPVNDRSEFVYFISSEHMRKDYGWDKHHPELIITYFDLTRKQMSAPGEIVSRGASPYMVVVPERPEGAERYAARELVDHIRQMSGCDLSILPESRYQTAYGPFISVGRTRLSRTVLSDSAFERLGEEGFVIDRRGRNMFIVGGRRRGALYGVYAFLEDLGVRWFTPTFTVVPKLKAVPLPSKRIREIPKVFYRDQLWNNGSTPTWRCRMRLNGEYARLPEEMGGSTQVRLGCHSYHALVSNTLFKEHPDWFALKEDGKRHAGYAQGVELCGTNPELRRYLLEKVRRDLRSHPRVEQYWVSQDDGRHSGCFCERCTAERVAHGGVLVTAGRKAEKNIDPTGMEDPRQRYRWSANTISLANFIARNIRDEFPRVKIKVLAYSYTWTPPDNMPIEDNVLVVLCGPAGDWFLPYAVSPVTRAWRAALRKWTGLGGNVQTYMYGGPNFGYWWPFPTWFTMCKNYRTAYEDGVRALYRQGAAAGVGSEFCELRAYITAKCAWDPERDWMKDIVEFTDAYYGAGASFVRGYMTWFDDYIQKNRISGHHYWGDNDGWRKYVPKDFVDKAEPFFRKALDATADTPLAHRHVRAAFLPVLFVKVMQSTLPSPRVLDDEIIMVEPNKLDELTASAKLFAEIMAENGYNRWNEKVPYDPDRNVMAAFGRRHPVRVLRNRTEKVVVAPTLGGRIVRWDVGALGRNIVHLPSSRVAGYPYGGGYEEYSQFERSSPGPAAEFDVVQFNDGRRLVLRAKLGNGLTVERTFELSSDAPRLQITSVYTNTTGKAMLVTLRSHPEFDYALFARSKLFAWQKPGRWVTYPMVRPGSRTGDITIKAGDMARGLWLFGDRDANFGLLNSFAPETVESLYAFYGKNYGCVNLELWGKKQTLKPGESTRLSQAFEYLPDLKRFLEDPR
ncbi:MAG: DUF4838 domain-containing protein [Kiritimatiellaeota bacterium]|nr:DUF4838 domain-containing protein [Kiritimatiellota bacterium]